MKTTCQGFRWESEAPAELGFGSAGASPSRYRQSCRSPYSVAFSPDSQRLASGRGDGTVMFCSCVAISPDNKLLAAGSGSDSRSTSGTVRIWNLESGVNGIALEEAFFLSVWDLAFRSDGTRIAAAIGDYKSDTKSTVPGEVVVWDVKTGVALQRLRGHRSCVWAVTFSPDGKRLASASGNRRRDTQFWRSKNVGFNHGTGGLHISRACRNSLRCCL